MEDDLFAEAGCSLSDFHGAWCIWQNGKCQRPGQMQNAIGTISVVAKIVDHDR